MDKRIIFSDLSDQTLFEALDTARVWYLKKHGWSMHATGGSQHVVRDPTYWWHGEERGGDPAHPFVIVQLTLSGWGLFEQDGQSHRIGADNGFLAIVPSDHLYYLPTASPDWRFIWLDIWQPYAVARLTALQKQVGPRLDIAADAPIRQRLLDILQRLAFGRYSDDYVLEEDVLGFVVALERHLMQSLHPASARDPMLQDVREQVLRRLTAPPSVSELAARYRQSRTGFTHLFKRTTGLQPAAYVDAVRLSRAAELLERGTDKLEVIARATGYTSATQFCKAFRKRYALAPGAYRAYYARKTSDRTPPTA